MKGKSMSDNISGMDAQHKRLAEYAKSLCRALKNGSALGDVTGGLDRLAKFADTHFVDEEDLMRLYGFDGLESHKRTHDLLFGRLTSLKRDLLADFGEKKKKELLAFLEGDFQYHIIEDMQAWESGEITKKFAYQRLREHESSGESGNHTASKIV